MPRIRSIKPEFFDDEDLCALSPVHRLCFIGLWCQADKAGRFEDRPKRLKARIAPFDDVDIDAILADLARAGFILRYVADGKPYGAVKPSSWAKHQRPRNDEVESEIPAPNGFPQAEPVIHSDESVTTQCLGKEGKGEEKERGTGIADGAAPDTAQQFKDAWNAAVQAPIANCQQVTTKRRRSIGARLAERPLTEWVQVFSRIQRSPFCRGENDREWIASFDWVIGSPDVAVKVLEGKYDDRRKAAREKPQAGQVDWFEECKAKHGGDCGLDRHRHMSRILREEHQTLKEHA